MVIRRDIPVMLVSTFVLWMGQRVTAVALPLVALTETGSVWATGLVGGAAGLPLITSGGGDLDCDLESPQDPHLPSSWYSSAPGC